MSDAERDPHVLISSKIGSSNKMLRLPSHRARWGWIVMLGAAKLRHPPGRFDSIAQVKNLAGEFRDCVAAWLAEGLLHAAPAMCPRCVAQFGIVGDEPGQLSPDALVVHDWKHHQERGTSRTTEWRRRTNETADETPNETTVEHRPPRVHAGGAVAVALAVEETERGAGENQTGYPTPGNRDSLDTYYELTRFRPWGIWSGDKLHAAINEYTDASVDTALRAENALSADPKTLLDRTLVRLAKDVDRARQDRITAPKTPKPKADRKAINDELRRLYAVTPEPAA